MVMDNKASDLIKAKIEETHKLFKEKKIDVDTYNKIMKTYTDALREAKDSTPARAAAAADAWNSSNAHATKDADEREMVAKIVSATRGYKEPLSQSQIDSIAKKVGVTAAEVQKMYEQQKKLNG